MRMQINRGNGVVRYCNRWKRQMGEAREVSSSHYHPFVCYGGF